MPVENEVRGSWVKMLRGRAKTTATVAVQGADNLVDFVQTAKSPTVGRRPTVLVINIQHA